VLVMPTVPLSALKANASRAAIGAFYEAALAINSIAGHAGLPQLAVPVGRVDGKPASLSFVAARGMDEALLAEAGRWAGVLRAEGFGG
jgi:amidase